MIDGTTKKSEFNNKENLTDDVKPKKEEKESKIGQKLIEKEKIQSGNVKINVFLEYLKACRLWISAIFILMYILSMSSDMASSFWLSDWSNRADKEKNTILHNNKSVSFDENSRFFRLGIYAFLCFSKCEYFSIDNQMIKKKKKI